jgi:predicted PurR-regulated permease PerM
VSESTRQWLTFGFIARAALVVIGIWALAQGLWLVRDILFIGFAAILLAVFFSILVDRLETAVPRWAATVATLLLFLGAVAGFWALAWPQVQGQVGTLGEEVPRILGSAVDWVRDTFRSVAPAAGAGEQAEQTMQQRFREEAMNLVAGALPLLNTAIGTLTGLIVTLFAAVFFVLDPTTYVEGSLRLVPESGRPRLRAALLEIGSTLKRWIAGMSLSMLVIAVASTAGLYLLGIPAALVLGLIAGVLVFVPFIGPVLSAVPALAMALTVSPIMMLWVGILYMGIQLMESNFLTPMVMREAVSLEPATTILFQLAMGVLFGFLGVFLAVPLLAALQVVVRRLYVDRLESDDAPTAQPAG